MTACRNFVMTGLPPVITTTLSGENLIPAAGPEIVGEGFAQLRDAGAGAIARVAVGDRPVHRLHDVRGRRDVDVAEMEGVHEVPLRFPGGRGLRDAEGSFGAQTFEPVRELLHAVPLLIELTIDPPGFRPG